MGEKRKRVSHMYKQTYDFNDNWLFAKLPADSWQPVSLPHTYNDEDGLNGKDKPYYRGPVCYRKTFDADFGGKRVFVEFGAANTVAEVYVNDTFVGKHEGGYAAFRFDITDFLKPADNVMAVTVSNAPTDYIPPITTMGDFTKMGGLYRGAKLIVTESAHIDLLDFGASGVYITPKNITEEQADVDICVKLANDGTSGELAVFAMLYDMQGRQVAAAEEKTALAAGEKGSVLLKTAVEKPVFWNGKENPYLYKAVIMVCKEKTLVDRTEETFGIRTFYVDKEKGFFLNGKYLDLHGVGYHQDSFENGWAMTDAQRDRDYQMMLDLGCTAVRLAHYQHCSYEYDLCDRYGIGVWAEVPIINQMSPDNKTMLTVPGFEENAKQQLTELIRQNYNHPCIFCWGISNELMQDKGDVLPIYGRLSAHVAKEDTTRLRTFADNQFWGPFLEMPVDGFGCNRYFGWYKEGPVEKFGPWFDEHYKKTKLPVCVTEYGGGGAISQHKDNVVWEEDIDIWGKRHYENYQSLLHERAWEQLAQRPYIWAKFVWCMFDFACANREEGDTVGQNDKGLATRQRLPKDAWYFYKSVWNKEPMVYLTQKRFSVRPAPVPEVKVYTNAQQAELFVNGKSAGFGTNTATLSTVFVWKGIPLNKGENQIAVKAYFADGTTREDKTVWIGDVVGEA